MLLRAAAGRAARRTPGAARRTPRIARRALRATPSAERRARRAPRHAAPSAERQALSAVPRAAPCACERRAAPSAESRACMYGHMRTRSDATADARARTRTHTVHVLLGSHGGMDDLLSDLMDLRVFFRFRIHHDEHSRRSPCSRMALKHGFTRFSPPPTRHSQNFEVSPFREQNFFKGAPCGRACWCPVAWKISQEPERSRKI